MRSTGEKMLIKSYRALRRPEGWAARNQGEGDEEQIC